MKQSTVLNTGQTHSLVSSDQWLKEEKLNSIDEVIDVLENIILASERDHDPLGYFAVLYHKVTKKVKEGIEKGFFEDGPRMERLDIVFAERYLKAYFAYRQNKPLTASWKRAFDLSSTYGSAVLQHLLVGINAHINLDLGIAAAEISKDGDMDDLKNDFSKINDILSSLVDEVQQGLSGVWPFLRSLGKIAGRIDNFLVDFLIGKAREEAWKFAKNIARRSCEELPALIARRDRQTARIAVIIGHPCAIAETIIQAVGLSEPGSVPERIRGLRA